MDESEIVKNELRFFSDCPRVFTLGEIIERINIPVNPEAIHNYLLSDDRFLDAGTSLKDESLFICKKSVLKWYLYLNIHLGKIRHTRINKDKFLFHIRSLSVSEYWDSPPKEIVNFGERFGLISWSDSSQKYVFPLAHLLSFVKGEPFRVIADVMKDISEKLNGEEFITQRIDEGISQLEALEAYVILCRTGCLIGFPLTLKKLQHELPHRLLTDMLKREGRSTLEQLANRIGRTRERIRQIEKKAYFRKVLIRPFVRALIYEVISRKGRMMYKMDSGYFLRMLIANCLGIPFLKIQASQMFIMGLSSKNLGARGCPKYTHNINSITKWIESKIKPVLLEDEFKKLSEFIMSSRSKCLPVGDRLTAVLKSIGRPAHYSEITEIHNELFSETAIAEKTVNIVLHGRRCKDNGVVWIGGKGMFALKRWGYKEPKQSLQKTVIHITQKIYRVTNKPVRFEVIIAEVGKRRKYVRHSSLCAAIKSNPGLEQISNGLFVPKKLDVSAKSISRDSLDKILQRFAYQQHLQG